MIITRNFAMANKETFKIKPIRQLIDKYVGNGEGWVDPFAGNNSPAEFKNDLNPDTKVTFHLHAKDFCSQLKRTYNGVLFDPPYSLTHVKQCYNGFGTQLFKEDAQYFPYNVIREIAPKIKLDGYAICFGWNSNGFPKKFGFKVIEVLIVNHGGGHNDTIVTVCKRTSKQLNIFQKWFSTQK
jgi:hypothetical protein